MLSVYNFTMHRFGDRTLDKQKIDELDFALALSVYESVQGKKRWEWNDPDEDLDLLNDYHEDKDHSPIDSFEFNLSYCVQEDGVKKIREDLAEKGFYAGITEEGTFAICVEGREAEMLAAVAVMEFEVC